MNTGYQFVCTLTKPLVDSNLKADSSNQGGAMLDITMCSLQSVATLDKFVQPNLQLTTINLSQNMLSKIEEVFSSCKALKKLDLSLNHIRVIENLRCSQLVELNLSKNQIEGIKPGCFEGVVQLKVLDLSMNKIEKIEGLKEVSGTLEKFIIYGN